MNTKKPRSSTKTPTAKSSTENTIAPEQNTNPNPNPTPEPITEATETGKKTSSKKSKAAKTKVIRDSFSFPEQDYRKISELKKNCLEAGIHVKKSEVLRAGLNLLSQLSLDELKQAVEKVDKIKTGRPAESVE